MTALPRTALALALTAVVGALFAAWPPEPQAARTAPLPVIRAPDLAPQWLTPEQLAAEPPAAFPDFELTDQAGRPLRRADLDGRIVVANFFFTNCNQLCPRLRTAMARVRDAYVAADDVQLLSHSVTPEFDRPELLAAYAKANAVDGERWRLLTGERAVLDRVTHEGYLVPTPAPGATRVMHTEWLILLDRAQRVRGIYNGTLPIEVGWLIRDIEALRGA